MATVAGLIIIVGALVTGSSVFAAPSTDANISDYSQCANDAPDSTKVTLDPTDCLPQGWINGILNANNSQYHEDQVTAQRLVLVVPKGGTATGRTVTLKYLARKGQGGVGNHAYDSLATWNVTQGNADRCQAFPAKLTCPAGPPTTYLIPVDNTKVADSVTGTGTPPAINCTCNHELPDADRQMTMFGGTITDVSTPVHDNATGSGDDYAQLTVTYSVTNTSVDRTVELVFGGHLAASIGSRGWGTTVGSSFINGGPYHIKLIGVDSSSIGNRDNQITSGAILKITSGTSTTLHETDSGGLDVSPSNNGDPITVVPGAYVTDVASVTPDNATGSVTFKWYADTDGTTPKSALQNCTDDTNGTTAGSGVAVNSGAASSDTVQFSNVGTFYWRAFFTGTDISLDSNSSCEQLIVAKLPSTISTAQSWTPQDTATIDHSGGSVVFTLYKNDNTCSVDADIVYGPTSAINVVGTGVGGTAPFQASTSNSSFSVTSVGASGDTYYWKAAYTADATHKDVTSSCQEATAFSSLSNGSSQTSP